MQNAPAFWAITGIGYGKGSTPEEALENYTVIQMRNFRKTRKEVLAESWGRIYQAPEGSKGFTLDRVVRWEMEDGTYVPATREQEVGEVGEIPEYAK